jgi:hypothetical protein
LTAFVDSTILVRHLTGDRPDQARRATAFLRPGQIDRLPTGQRVEPTE